MRLLSIKKPGNERTEGPVRHAADQRAPILSEEKEISLDLGTRLVHLMPAPSDSSFENVVPIGHCGIGVIEKNFIDQYLRSW
jgi:hypothetical protein